MRLFIIPMFRKNIMGSLALFENTYYRRVLFIFLHPPTPFVHSKQLSAYGFYILRRNSQKRLKIVVEKVFLHGQQAKLFKT